MGRPFLVTLKIISFLNVTNIFKQFMFYLFFFAADNVIIRVHFCYFFKIQPTRWESDRLTRGSYSYLSLASDRMAVSPGDLVKISTHALWFPWVLYLLHFYFCSF